MPYPPGCTPPVSSKTFGAGADTLGFSFPCKSMYDRHGKGALRALSAMLFWSRLQWH